MFVKVCGLTDIAQIDKAIACGYDAIGVVTYRKSKRFCPPEKAGALAEYARGKIKTFVVGLIYADVQDVADLFDYTQIYEARPIPGLVLASKEKPSSDIDYEYFIYDASIGSGVFQQFPTWLKDMAGKVIIAGGLTKENVCAAIQDIKPFGVDVSSGVEKNGVKDFELMKKFIAAVRNCK
jgi:phosphoribosylanthranilate isomerase